MAWGKKQQDIYMPLVERSHKYGKEMADKFVKDFNLTGKVTSNYVFSLQDDFSEAFRTGAIEALIEEEKTK